MSKSSRNNKFVRKCHNCMKMSKLFANVINVKRTVENGKTLLNSQILKQKLLKHQLCSKMSQLFDNAKIVRKCQNCWKMCKLFQNIKIVWKCHDYLKISKLFENVKLLELSKLFGKCQNGLKSSKLFTNMKCDWCQNGSKMPNLFKNVNETIAKFLNYSKTWMLIENGKWFENW